MTDITSGDGTYTYGTNATVTAEIADTRFSFVEWRVNGTKVSGSIEYTFIVTGETLLEAIYEFNYTTYQIDHIADMYWLAERVNNGYDFNGVTFYLTRDLDFSNVTDQAWTTIGNSTTKFAGTFQGNGYTLSNTSTNITIFNSPTGTINNVNISGNITLGATQDTDTGLKD